MKPNPQRAFFESLAQTWDATQPPDRAEIFDRLLAPFDAYLAPCGRILEVGTGTGALIPVLRQRHPQAELVSIDLAWAMLHQAKDRGAAVVQADVHHLPFGGQSFSAVICHNSFPHFADKPYALGELRRILPPGGILLILHNLNRARVNAIHQNAQSEVIHHDLLPSGAELAAMLLVAGFSPRLVEDSSERYTICAEGNIEKLPRTSLDHGRISLFFRNTTTIAAAAETNRTRTNTR